MTCRRVLLLTGLCGCLSGGCVIGSIAPARTPHGSTVELVLSGHGTIPAELLAVQDTALIVLVSDTVALVRWADIWQGHVRVPSFDFFGGSRPDSQTVNRLRLYSRFPQGVSDDVFERLLSAHGQHWPGTASTEQAIRDETRRFQNRRVAIAEGYRLVGADFPGMGEHWVNVARLMSGVLDPARPAVLSYVMLSGRPTLIGVAFALVAAPGDTLPVFPAGRDAWHFHVGTLDDESFPEGPHPAVGSDARVAMVHAWVWLKNPSGTFAKNNWALPYVRTGLDVPQNPDPDAARALAAGTVNRSFYREWMLRAGLPSDSADRLLDANAAAVRPLLGQPADVRDRALARLWRSFCAAADIPCDRMDH